MFGGMPAVGHLHRRPSGTCASTCTDTGESVWVQLGRFTGTDPDDGDAYDDDDIARSPTRAPSPTPSSAARPRRSTRGCGGAATTAEIAVSGDPPTCEQFRRAVNQPIN